VMKLRNPRTPPRSRQSDVGRRTWSGVWVRHAGSREELPERAVSLQARGGPLLVPPIRKPFAANVARGTTFSCLR